VYVLIFLFSLIPVPEEQEREDLEMAAGLTMVGDMQHSELLNDLDAASGTRMHPSERSQ
jgi:hypothetical protein